MPLKVFEETSKVRILAVAGGKGGVGKSTVALHTALALKDQGCRVGLLDGDLYGPSVQKMLPEDHAPREHNGRWFPATAGGLAVMSIAYFRKEGQGALVRAPIANQLISHFLERVDWGGLDWLVIDFPPGTGDIPLTLAVRAPITGALLVTTPQELALLDVRKAAHLFEQAQVPILGVVENMSGTPGHPSPFGEGGGERLAAELATPLLAKIPLDAELCSLADRGRSAFLSGRAKGIFAKIALQLRG